MAKEYKNDLAEILSSLDKKDYKLYTKMTDDQKKDFQPFVMMRYMSSLPDGPEAIYALVAINELVNTNFWDLTNEKELQVKLLAACGIGKKSYHQWISNKSENANALHSFVKAIFDNRNWHCNKMEIEMFCRNNTLDDIINLCMEYGITKDVQKKITDQYKKIYM